jgi:hypothetical protein
VGELRTAYEADRAAAEQQRQGLAQLSAACDALQGEIEAMDAAETEEVGRDTRRRGRRVLTAVCRMRARWRSCASSLRSTSG